MGNKSKSSKNIKSNHLDFLEKEFDFIYNKDMKNPLKEGLKKILDRIENISKILETLLQPENNYSAIHEYSHLNEDEKREISETYKKYMYLERAIIERLLNNNQESIEVLLNQIISEWKELKQRTLRIIIKIRDSWNDTGSIGMSEDYKKYLG